MKIFLSALEQVLNQGTPKSDRTGTGTISLFGMQQRYNLQDGFPAVTTKKLAWRSVVSELIWFLEGSGDEKRLREILHGDRNSEKSTIWTANAEAAYWKPHAKFEGDLGRVYGVQWRHWKSTRQVKAGSFKDDWGNYYSISGGAQEVEVDQLSQLIEGIKRDPHGRRHILSAWNPGEIESMALPPCHCFAQFYVSDLTREEINTTYMRYRGTLTKEEKSVIDVGREGRAKTIQDLKDLGLPTTKLSCQMYQRSGDGFLGVPFNIASYSLLTHMVAHVCNLEVGEFVHVLGDMHIYLNHITQVEEQLKREPLPLARLWLNPEVTDITKFTMDDIKLIGYQSHEAITAPMAV
jgi:thymidylate synthase